MVHMGDIKDHIFIKKLYNLIWFLELGAHEDNYIEIATLLSIVESLLFFCRSYKDTPAAKKKAIQKKNKRNKG